MAKSSRRLVSLWLKLMIFYVYVLKSIKSGKRYVGYTSKLPEERLLEHNGGANQFTRKNKPFILVYWENYEDKTIAIKRENFLKSGQGRKFLDSILRPSSSVGRAED